MPKPAANTRFSPRFLAPLACLVIFGCGSGNSSNGADPAGRHSNASPIRLTLTKEADNAIRFTVHNTGNAMHLQRYGKEYGAITFEKRSRFGTWSPLKPDYPPGFCSEPVAPTPQEWVTLSNGDTVSWTILPRIAWKMRPRDRIRITWLPAKESPIKRAVDGSRFPAEKFVREVVLKEGG